MSKPLISLLLVLSIAVTWVFYLWYEKDSDACLPLNEQIAVCATSDMAKLPNHGAVPLEHASYAIKKQALRLQAARNETIAFQLVLKNKGLKAPANITLSMTDLVSGKETISANTYSKIYQAWYHWVDKGGYSWGPNSHVLAWPDFYPDALVPQSSGCEAEKERLFEAVEIKKNKAGLQAVWFDIYVPKTQVAGLYRSQLRVETDAGESLLIPFELEVHSAMLPDKPSIDAVGEVYRSYRLEGAGEDFATSEWRAMAHCYQKLAHKHRLVFIERSPVYRQGTGWDTYDWIYGPILDGSLFSEAEGYIGPGENTPVTVWRTPWPQDYDVSLQEPLDEAVFTHFEELAAQWVAHVAEKSWHDTYTFAYIFDEVDGPEKEGRSDSERDSYLRMVHEQMQKMQSAIDRGAGEGRIDLMWTSHSNPQQWEGQQGLDLQGYTRLWVPNAHAAATDFLQNRQASGEKIWFYHSGHPAVGAHSINVSGIEMRTWGVIGARYGFDGQLMWAVNLGSDAEPFARPSYKDDDDRFGNGVMVYPGNQLPKIGFKAVPGPIPSIRLKMWRRGLQDAEIIALARQKNPDKTNQLLEAIIPRALSEGDGKAVWSRDPAEWIDFRRQLLKIASTPE